MANPTSLVPPFTGLPAVWAPVMDKSQAHVEHKPSLWSCAGCGVHWQGGLRRRPRPPSPTQHTGPLAEALSSTADMASCVGQEEPGHP